MDKTALIMQSVKPRPLTPYLEERKELMDYPH